MRFYNNKLPEVDDIVICRVKKIASDAIYVNLLEYNEIEGMVQLANASTRRKKKSICLLKENRQYPLLVITVDKEKGYVDLSNKFISDEDKDYANEKYDLYRKVLKIFNHFMYSKFQNEYDDNTFYEYAEKTLWKIDKNKCYKYFSDLYYNNCNMSDVDLNDEDKVTFKASLEKFFGSFEVLSKLSFILRNPNYGGVNNIKLIFNELNEKYNIITRTDVVPTYIIDKKSKNKDENENLLNDIDSHLINKAKEYNMIYSKKELISSFI